jgi:hypothetical protein
MHLAEEGVGRTGSLLLKLRLGDFSGWRKRKIGGEALVGRRGIYKGKDGGLVRVIGGVDLQRVSIS